MAARRLTALIYREYLDPQYLIPKPDKLVAADVNEPAFTRRVPGTVLYASPGDWLRIHVKNADFSPHSFHLHGVRYVIDSDGSWPFGTVGMAAEQAPAIVPLHVVGKRPDELDADAAVADVDPRTGDENVGLVLVNVAEPAPTAVPGTAAADPDAGPRSRSAPTSASPCWRTRPRRTWFS